MTYYCAPKTRKRRHKTGSKDTPHSTKSTPDKNVIPNISRHVVWQPRARDEFTHFITRFNLFVSRHKYFLSTWNIPINLKQVLLYHNTIIYSIVIKNRDTSCWIQSTLRNTIELQKKLGWKHSNIWIRLRTKRTYCGTLSRKQWIVTTRPKSNIRRYFMFEKWKGRWMLKFW